MNFYHFRPSCKVIKRSRNSKYLIYKLKNYRDLSPGVYRKYSLLGKGPFFTQFSDEIIAELNKNPEVHLKNGEVLLANLGIENSYSREVFVGGLPLDVTERKYGSNVYSLLWDSLKIALIQIGSV